MNIQELQTIVHNKLPIKIFLLNNGGYVSIKQTQGNFFGLPYIGCDGRFRSKFPAFTKVAKAYGLKAVTIKGHKGMQEKIKSVFKASGPVLCDVVLERDYKFFPRLSSRKEKDGRMVSSPLEDMFPFLSREEFKSNMLIKPLGEL